MKNFFGVLICLCILSAILVAILPSPSMVDKKPCAQLGTTWMSEDGMIVFSVSESGPITGTLMRENQIISLYIAFETGAGTAMYIYPESGVAKNHYEYWACSFKSEETFTATVKETTFFEVGQKIVFKRQGDGSVVS